MNDSMTSLKGVAMRCSVVGSNPGPWNILGETCVENLIFALPYLEKV